MNNNLNLESENKSMLEFLLQEFKTSDTGEIQRKLSKLDKQQLQLLKAKYELWKEAKKKKQATKAAHGAKLDYVKSLKHICPEGLELYYFKKGRNLECGCKGKKIEEGAKIVEKAKGGTVAKFKQGKKNVVVNGSTKQPMLDAKAKEESERKARIERDRKSLEDYEKGIYGNSDNPPDSKAMSKKAVDKSDSVRKMRNTFQTTQDKCGGKMKKKEKGGAVEAFKAKCGSKMKKHKLGGSLNGIPFYLGGTSKGGITEKSDNTRVERIPNKGEGVYEKIPINGWDFVPGIGTYWEARRLDQEDPNASVARFGISLAGDLAGAGMIGSVAKAAGKASKIQKALKARGYQLFTKDGSLWFRLPKKIIRGYGDKLYTYEIPNIYGGSSFKTIPTVDYAPAVMAPLVLTLRVPAEAPFFNYSK